ncbi:MAG: hypothetical protein Q9167_000514 [Letrouitia subvulpina]
MSMAYCQYLRKILASESLVPYETFSHPVAGIIAVTSRSQKPLETLRKIYAETRSEGKTFPDWVGTEYLRYYLLIHDEDTDDIIKTTALFDLMKRHFGLHCHLLRLRSTQCVESDDDSVAVAPCKWAPPEEDLSRVRSQGASHSAFSYNNLTRTALSDFTLQKNFIFDSDASAIRNFVRELVTQSVVPFMESRILTWNDQVASRRRGLSGRFMSLSKRWTGLGSTKSTTSSSAANTGSSASNFDFQRGLYAPETPEAIIRQLADYAFMLRDWKLAHTTYDFVRTDFSSDKAWTYYASAAEMAAIAFLLLPPNLSPRPRSESVQQLLDTAVYSYLTRCSMPSSVIRAILLGIELLKVKGLGSSNDAARWGTRLLSLGILTPLAQALVANRVSDCYREGSVIESSIRGPCQRRAAFWSVLAAEAWTRVGKFRYAQDQLDIARPVFKAKQMLPFISMQPFWFSLAQNIEKSLSDRSSQGDDDCIDVQSSDSVEQLSGLQLSRSTRTE